MTHAAFRPLLVFWTLFLSLTAQAALPLTVEQALQQHGIPLSHTAILVQGVDSPTPRLTLNAQAAMNPASVMKLITTYTALQKMGPQRTWTTLALTSGMPTSSDTLEEPLYIQSSGDPKFAIEHLTSLLRQVRQRGIRHLNGGILIDRQAFAAAPINQGQFDGLAMRPYNVGPDSFLLNFHALTLSLEISASATNPVTARLETPLQGLAIANALKPGKVNCDDWKDAITPKLSGAQGQWVLTLMGQYNPACGNKTLNLAPFAAEDYAAALIPTIWAELGGTLGGPIRSGSSPTGLNAGSAVIWGKHTSPALAEIVRDINKFSNNVMARQLFLNLASQSPASMEDAQQSVRNALEQMGLSFPELVLENGSGLSRRERISAASLGQLLRHAWTSPVMPEFMASLPVLGLDGTMKKRLTDSASTGRGHIKTGSLDGVKTIAGYVLSQSGQRYAVVFLINDPKASQGQAAMDALLKWVAETQ